MVRLGLELGSENTSEVKFMVMYISVKGKRNITFVADLPRFTHNLSVCCITLNAELKLNI